MKIRRASARRARIEIIPMIDVVFFLLVFFMISSLSMSHVHGLPVHLPKTSAGEGPGSNHTLITIQKDGTLFINGISSSLETLGTQLAYAMKLVPDNVVVLHADTQANYGFIIEVMAEARKIGVRKFALATDPHP